MALSQVCALQKAYGKTTAELEILVEGFCWVLASIPMPDILRAIVIHVSRSNEIPTPSDIVAIIDPPKQALSASRYVSLCKRERDGFMLYGRDLDFKRAFEAQENEKVRGGSPLLRECRQQIEAHHPPAIGYDDE